MTNIHQKVKTVRHAENFIVINTQSEIERKNKRQNMKCI